MPQVTWHESPYWLAAGWTMFQFLGIGVLLWIFGGLLRFALRRVEPQVRYAVALGLLLAAAAVPAGLFVATLDSAEKLAAPGDFQTSASIRAPNEILQRQPAPREASAVDAEAARIPDSAASVGSATFSTSIEWKSVVTSGLNAVRDLACRWLPWLWLSGTPLILVALACGVSGAGRLRRAGRLLEDGDVVAANQRLRAALRVGRQVAIVACDRVAAPILVGILRPAILLPPAVLAGFSPEQMEMILLHELAHVRRCDNLVNFVQRVIEAALFFHPVVWWLSSWVRLEREECCDRVVVAHTGRPQAYAETLAALALPGMTPRHAAAAMADCHLVTRIRHILNLEDEIMNVSRFVFVAAAGLLIFVGCFAASLAQTKDAASDTAEKPPVGGQADTVGGPVQFPSDASIESTEALRRAIDAGYIQENPSRYNVSLIDEEHAEDERAWEASEVLQNPAFSTTQLGIRYLVRLRDGRIVQPAGAQRKWGPEQATGAPDSPDYPNNQGTAWCPATADGQEEWLELTYGEPVEPLVLVVYECLKPGALTRVIAYDAEGNELNAWSGKDPSPPDSGNGSAISVVPLKLKKIKIVRVRMYFDSPHVEGWNEIDAAGILDVKGAMHWATAATASSTWVDPATAATTLPGAPLSDAELLDAKVSITELRGSAIDPVKLALGGIIRAESVPILPGNVKYSENIKYLSRWLVADPKSAGQELIVAPKHDNEARNGDSDRVTLFEERIKKLEADLAALRETLQQLKPPLGDKNDTP
jgi:beta-lactamase regulating signal transducer with metallopeptidase domain